MVARKYALVAEFKMPVLSGQAKIVMTALMADRTPRLATDITATVGEDLVTRQDRHRVVLYYILVFKSKGIVSAFEETAVEEVVEEQMSLEMV